MPDPRETRTNAADSAPGVDDGRKGAPSPGMNSKPGGRRMVLWIVGSSLVVLALVFIARPLGTGSDSEMVEPGGTRAEIVASDVPGASQPDTAESARTP